MLTFPRTKSRPITVEGRLYRWMLKLAKDDIIGSTSGVVRLVVQDDEHLRGAFEAWLCSRKWFGNPDFAECRDNAGPHKVAVKPSDVAVVIKRALVEGWQPTKAGLFKVIGPLDLEHWFVGTKSQSRPPETKKSAV